MAQPRKGRRASADFRVESLEPRTLLSVGASAIDSVSGPWAVGASVNAQSALFVKFQAGASGSDIQADLNGIGGRELTRYPDGSSLIQLAPWAKSASAVAELKSQGRVVYAEADASYRVDSVPYVAPNDPFFGQQWALSTIDAPQAWAVSTGSASTVVAVLDTGLDLNNPDFAGRLWINPAVNQDGYLGDVHGWNFVNNNANIQDANGHGTHVTGILGATGNNGAGVAGVDWNARIMPIKVLDSLGNGSTDAAVAGIYFAVQHGAKVINASWGGDVYSQAMLDALNYANANGVVFVTAAGNGSSDNDQITTYPASYRTPNELVVAAIDPGGKLASYSNFGPTTVDVAAPGTNILSTVLLNQFQAYTGTSMSTPFVTGTVSLLAGLHPTFTAAQLVSEVRATAKPDPALKGLVGSGGVVDPYYALTNNASGTTAAGGPGGAAPSLSISDVEYSILTSGGVASLLNSNPGAYLYLVDKALLGRSPTPADVSFEAGVLQSGVSWGTIIQGLQAGHEAQVTRVARWYQDELGSTETIAQLEAAPDVNYWASQLALGVPPTQVQANISRSSDYLNTTDGTPGGYVAGLFSGLLGRQAQPSDVDFGLNLLNSGKSEDALVKSFLASPEGRAAAIARLYQDEFGWTASLATLKADPGVLYWAAFLTSA